MWPCGSSMLRCLQGRHLLLVWMQPERLSFQRQRSARSCFTEAVISNSVLSNSSRQRPLQTQTSGVHTTQQSHCAAGIQIDVSRAGGAADLAPVPQSLSKAVWAVVRSDGRRCQVEPDELLQHHHHIPGQAAPAEPNGQTETAVLIDHIRNLEPAAIGCCDDLEVPGPNPVGLFGAMAPDQAVNGPCSRARPGRGPLQSLLPPEPLHPLVVHGAAITPDRQSAIRRLQRVWIAPRSAQRRAAAISRR